MLISQIRWEGGRAVAVRNGTEAAIVRDTPTVHDLARDAIEQGLALRALVGIRGLGPSVNMSALAEESAFLTPIDHPDPAHLHLSGTGLHPDWMYKGNGHCLSATGARIQTPVPCGGRREFIRIAGLYLIAAGGRPFRIGWSLAAEFCDPSPAPSGASARLRTVAIGPEILVGPLPRDSQGSSRILRDGQLLRERPFRAGETGMPHPVAALEHRHFRDPFFRQAGDVHLHLFGNDTGGSTDTPPIGPGDEIVIQAAPFGLPLRNRLIQTTDTGMALVETL